MSSTKIIFLFSDCLSAVWCVCKYVIVYILSFKCSNIMCCSSRPGFIYAIHLILLFLSHKLSIIFMLILFSSDLINMCPTDKCCFSFIVLNSDSNSLYVTDLMEASLQCSLLLESNYVNKSYFIWIADRNLKALNLLMK